MKVRHLLFFLIPFFYSCQLSDINLKNNSQVLYFDAPATIWEECVPLGNGRIGMMPDGGITNEIIVLNDISMWSGSPQNTDNPQARTYLPRIRQLLFEGRNDEAQELMYDTFVCEGEGSALGDGANAPYGSFQLLGNLRINYSYPGNNGVVTGYKRILDLENAVSTVSYQKGNIRYKREYFTSFTEDQGILFLSSDQDRALHFTIGMDRPERYEVSADGKDLVMKGALTNGYGEDGIQYEARVRIRLPKGGAILVGDSTLTVENASEAILFIGLGTDYFETPYVEQLSALLSGAQKKEYLRLKKEHIDTYQTLYGRVRLDLPGNGREKLPLPERLRVFQTDKDDPALVSLYFQFGRYLLISSTRPGLLPPNLQGLWANTIHTPWNGDYHLNINLQMNHWPVETTNLSELHHPLIEWTKQQVKSGEHTARVFYNAQGWVTHILGNVWEFTAPGEHPSWGATNTSAAWLCAHLYNHYLYNPDINYLKEVYPVMKGAALFFVDMLVEDPRNGYLVTAPTTSPENGFYMPDRNIVYVTAGSTMDNQLIRELFSNTIEAAHLLQTDSSFVALLEQKQQRLMPTTIGKDGRVMEWLEEYKEAEPTHRHVSHLYGLYPGNEISPDRTPALAEAARKTLEVRGDRSTGWSMAWKINFRARLGEGEHAYKLLGDLLYPAIPEGESKATRGGTSPNLFCSHPPFQIDGNLGACAGIAEMLLQSHTGVIKVLPAWPKQLDSGSFKGLKVIGGAEIAAQWENNQVKKITLKATHDNTFVIELPGHAKDVRVRLNQQSVSYPVVENRIPVKMRKEDYLIMQF
ncbi:MAG: glycoside hydrolase family 95 protein [Tannerellaceae bacterium]|nr:glycoside hydrolase family 95 protein [Tannerellaceae bacterium]